MLKLEKEQSGNRVTLAVNGVVDTETSAQLPGVADVKVLGVPHEVYGEEVAAAIVMEDGAMFDKEEADLLLKSKLAKYKIPAHYIILDSFPLLGSGKIDAIALKREVLSHLSTEQLM